MQCLQRVRRGGRWSALCSVGGSLAIVLLLGLGVQPRVAAAADSVAVYATAPFAFVCNDPSGNLCNPTKNGSYGQEEVFIGDWSDVKQTATPVVNVECTSFQIGQDTQYAIIEEAYTKIRLEDPADANTFVEYKSDGYERIRSQVAGCNGGTSGTTVPIPIIEETTYGSATYRTVPTESCTTTLSCTPAPTSEPPASTDTPAPTRRSPEGIWDYVLRYSDGVTIGTGTIVIGPAGADGTHNATCTYEDSRGGRGACSIYTSGDPFNWRSRLGIPSDSYANFGLVTGSIIFGARYHHFNYIDFSGTTAERGGVPDTYDYTDIITLTRR